MDVPLPRVATMVKPLIPCTDPNCQQMFKSQQALSVHVKCKHPCLVSRPEVPISNLVLVVKEISSTGPTENDSEGSPLDPSGATDDTENSEKNSETG